jgi:uncharacterized protein YacL (UPF0231 family)
MNKEDMSELAIAIAKGMADAHKRENPINPQNIFYAIGVGAVVYVGWSFNHSVEMNSEKLDTLTGSVQKLVNVTQSQQDEINKRGLWMDGVNIYSEQSRIKDNSHDERIKMLEDDIKELRE